MPETNPDWIAGVTRVAVAIAEHFKIPCTKEVIKGWQKLNPGFPPPAISGSNRYSRKECFGWIETVWLPKRKAGGGDVSLAMQAAEAEYRRTIRDDESEEMDIQEKKGSLIDIKVARNTIASFAHQYKTLVRAEVERNTPTDRREKLLGLGVSADIVAIFHEWDLTKSRQTIDKIEDECEKICK